MAQSQPVSFELLEIWTYIFPLLRTMSFNILSKAVLVWTEESAYILAVMVEVEIL